MKTSILITALLLLLAANLFMMYVSPFGLKGSEGFQMKNTQDGSGNMMPMERFQDASEPPIDYGYGGGGEDVSGSMMPMESFQDASGMTLSPEDQEKMKKMLESRSAVPEMGMESKVTEGFASYALSSAGGAKDKYEPIGAFDNIRLSTGNNISSWRYTAPNEPLMGPAFKPGDNELFIFKNNQCKPECCGASFSCGGGCVCTTPQQRDYINGRGGNRNLPDDAF